MRRGPRAADSDSRTPRNLSSSEQWGFARARPPIGNETVLQSRHAASASDRLCRYRARSLRNRLPIPRSCHRLCLDSCRKTIRQYDRRHATTDR
ncbi:unnamed protein product [Leptidea sinapis]|uniref:Uncharacterized protein n=1 Tax=Leptidea sinapis TaxID=189913 RepID=A0A5E4QFJ0_9NEOP|nr:unnamed protein product [Leptidea sinapis]